MVARTTRWSLLIVALALGVALMHTLGHSVHTRSPAMPGMAVGAAASAPDRDVMADLPTAATGELFASSLADRWLVRAGRSVHDPLPFRHGMDPSVMCLAVLTTFLLLAAAAYRILRTGRGVASRSCPRVAGRPRAPPGTPVGRSVAALSVMRI